MARSRSPRHASRDRGSPARAPDPARCVYIAGIPHDILQTEFEEALAPYGPVHRTDLKKGFAFVFMRRDQDAQYMVNKLDGSRLLGARVRVEWAKGAVDTSRRETERKAAAMSCPTSTLFMVNFDEDRIDDKEIRDFFRDYDVRAVSIRKNFAFIEFSAVGEARAALEALNGTRLHDRPIVLEYKAKIGGINSGPPPKRPRSPSYDRGYRDDRECRRRSPDRRREDEYDRSYRPERSRRSRSRTPPPKRYRRSRSRSR